LSNTEQKELASQFCEQINTDLGYLRGYDDAKREKLVNRINSLTITSAILPIVVTFISAYVYIITQQVITFVSSFVNVIPPILMNNTKAKIEHYNKCLDLKLRFTSLRGDTNRLAVIGQLKDQYLADVKTELKHLSDALKEALGLPSASQ